MLSQIIIRGAYQLSRLMPCLLCQFTRVAVYNCGYSINYFGIIVNCTIAKKRLIYLILSEWVLSYYFLSFEAGIAKAISSCKWRKIFLYNYMRYMHFSKWIISSPEHAKQNILSNFNDHMLFWCKCCLNFIYSNRMQTATWLLYVNAVSVCSIYTIKLRFDKYILLWQVLSYASHWNL